MSDYYSQCRYRCRLEWGRRGARAAAARGDVLVVVDVLSFSTATITAVAHGAIVFPCAHGEATADRAVALNAEPAVARQDVPTRGRFSLSPVTMEAARPGDRILLASPNGATCTRYGKSVPLLIVGALVNAGAVAAFLDEFLTATPDRAVTVLACGERWSEPDADDGDLRFALEDFLGAGAIFAHLSAGWTRSPEASAAEAAFRATEPNLADALCNCGSGIELTEKGYMGDVERAAVLSVFSHVPILRDGERLEAVTK